MVLIPILTIPLADVPLLTFFFQALQGAIGDIPSHSMAWDIFLSGKKGKSSFFKKNQILGCWALKVMLPQLESLGFQLFVSSWRPRGKTFHSNKFEAMESMEHLTSPRGKAGREGSKETSEPLPGP